MSKQEMTSDLRFQGGMAFAASTGSGHSLRLDSSPAFGGQNEGARPMELLLAGLGGCTGMDVVSILRKMRQPVTGYEVNVSGVSSETHPKIFTSILVEHVLYGPELSESAVQKAVRLSEERYCSAHAMLAKAASIEHRVRIVREDPAPSEQPVS